MNKLIFTALAGIGLAAGLTLTLAQPTPSDMPPPMENAHGKYIWVAETNSLPRFDLSFSGGTPEDLIAAIVRVTGKPLNTVIPDDCKNLQIADFSVRNVNLAELFEALKNASSKVQRFMVDRPDNNWSFEERNLSYGFSTTGPPTENSIWCFAREGEPGSYQTVSATICRFYQLSPYLDAGYKVDDITTAIQTAWKMLGDTNPPSLTYHKETKLLIATGECHEIYVIDDALKQLSTNKQNKMEKMPLEKSGN
jgi:hypothetical protein